jgi:hypothetical protein
MRIAQHNQEGKLTLSVSLNGSGTRDEQAFVNLLASTLAIEVPRQSDQAALTRWIENGATALDMSKQVNLAEQIRAEVSQTSGMIKELKDRFAATDVNALAAMIEKLETQKSELKSAKGLDDAHPEIVQLQSQIEELRGRMLSDPDFRPVQRGSIADTESGDVIKNRFYQASAKLGETKPTPADFATALSELDLSPIGALATQLKTHAESIRDLQQDIDTNLIEGNRASDSCIASLTGVSYSTRPTLLAETSTLPPWLLVVPCLFAAMVSLYYNPIRDRLQLKSIDDVVKSLGVGIIGEMPSTQPVAATTRGESWSAVSVRMAEYSLLAIGGLMLISCVMRPQILAAVLSNPILALANWFWLIVS